MLTSLLLFTNICTFCVTFGAYEPDRVTDLPNFDSDFNSLNFDVYSGYLESLTGYLFYFFTESSSGSSLTDPLVLWLNGGPGCSSLLGGFDELGPFHPYTKSTPGDSVEYNPYAWNNFANMLFLESPPCVGFSIPKSYNCDTYRTNDNQTKYDNYYAIQSFLIKYPEYINREFYISGESYAGHYIPQLATFINEMNNAIDNDSFDNNITNFVKINLKGVAIGNPYTERDSNMFEGWLKSMYNFGIINPTEYDSMLEGNCTDGIAVGDCANQLWSFIDRRAGDLNVYDVNVLANCSGLSFQQVTLLRYLQKNEDFESNLQDMNIWAYPYDPCNEWDLIWYMNDPNVWEALHVNTSWVTNNHTWYWCSFFWTGYDENLTTSEYGRSQVEYYYDMLDADTRVLVYSGNDDLVCAYSGTRYWVYGNLSSEVKGDEISNGWKSWHVNGEVGGWYQQWSKFTFLVVRDAGHEVPEYQPARAYAMMRRFLINNYTDVYETLSDFSVNVESYGGGDSTNNSNDNDNSGILNSFWAGLGIGIAICLLIGVVIGVVISRKTRKQLDNAKYQNVEAE